MVKASKERYLLKIESEDRRIIPMPPLATTFNLESEIC
jgi:hypothetical protein